MEHTIKAYIGRQSTEVLEVVLRQYTESYDKLMANSDTVLLILNELKRREGYSDGEMTPYIQKAWERYLRHFEEHD